MHSWKMILGHHLCVTFRNHIELPFAPILTPELPIQFELRNRDHEKYSGLQGKREGVKRV